MQLPIIRLSAAAAAFALTSGACAAASAAVVHASALGPQFAVQNPAMSRHALRDGKKIKPTLYIGDNMNSRIQVFDVKKKSVTLARTITTGLYGPQGITTDESGNLYAANLYGNNVTVYAPGASAPFRTISDDVSSPTDVKVDAFGNVYVANSPGFGAQSYILLFPAGSGTPSTAWYTPTGNEALSSIALLNATQQGETSVYALGYYINPSTDEATGSTFSCYPGYGQCVALNSAFGQTGGIAVENSPGGSQPFTYLAVDQYVPGVDTFTNSQLTGRLVTGGTPQDIAFNSTRTDYFVADSFYGQVVEHAYPSGAVVQTIHPSSEQGTFVVGVAVAPAGTYF